MHYNNEKLIEILKQAGWYQGRKIELQYVISYYNNENTPLSDAQISFLEEFGDIEGIVDNEHPFKFFSDPLFWYHVNSKGKHEPLYKSGKTADEIGILDSYSPLNQCMLQEQITMLEVGWIDILHMPLYISSDGRLFRDDGYDYGKICMDTLAKLLIP